MQLPPHLRHALDHLITATPMAELTLAATKLSERYRRVGGKEPLGILSATEAKAYSATRLPATFCATAKVLESLCETLPNFTPTSILDIGAGPGTATLAAATHWPEIEQATLLEPNAHLLAFGKTLLAETTPRLQAIWLNAEITRFALQQKHDLVLSGYVLNEVLQEKGAAAFRDTVKKMWNACSDTLVILEPGTPAGQKIILEARAILLGAGAHIAAPCPHALTCPLAASPDKWCHFSVRVERGKMHRQLKQDATLSYEDEKFSYIVVTRSVPEKIRYRIIGHPRGTKPVEADTCQHTGEAVKLKVGKSSPEYAALRKGEWGDEVK